MDKEYEKCFVYQCLSTICRCASLESEKFIKTCCDCPAFKNWIKERERRRNNAIWNG